MPRKIFRETKMQGGNIYRPANDEDDFFTLNELFERRKRRIAGLLEECEKIKVDYKELLKNE